MQRSAQRLTVDGCAAWPLLLALAITLTSCAEKVDPNTGAGVERFIAGDLSGALEVLRAAERAGFDHHVGPRTAEGTMKRRRNSGKKGCS